jgi:tetratricopeptide (TPR) repeat protein
MIADCPYPGAHAFQEGDHDRFRGRDAEVAGIFDRWTANRLTVVTGPVASGKTSLLRAGVHPLMSSGRPGVLPPGRLSGGMTIPSAAIPEYNPYAYALLSAWSPHEAPARLAGVTVSEFVRRGGRQLGRRGDGIVFAAIDQVEDIVIDASTGQRRAWRRQFLDDLARACEAAPYLHLLLVTRVEGLDMISATLGPSATYEVESLSIRNGLQAVEAPAAAAGRAFAPDAARQLIDDLRTSRIVGPREEQTVVSDRVEPALLQVVCRQLWDALVAESPQITRWDVREFGDVDAALTTFCAQVIGEVAAECDLSSRQLHSWLLDTFVTDGGAYEGLTATAGLPNAVAQSLVDRHLLASSRRSGTRWYQLLSDRLIEPLRHVTVTRASQPTADARLQAAKRQQARGEVDLARRHATRALQAQPSLHGQPSLRIQADAEVLLGNVAHEHGEPADALPHYREATSLMEAAGDAGAAVLCLAAVGQTLLTLGEIPEAITEFRAVLARAPNDPSLQTQFALSLWQLGVGEAAVALLNGMLAIDSGNLDALRARGEILADLGDPRGAMLDLERQSVADRPSARAAHGLALAGLGDYQQAVREARATVSAAPRDGRVLLYAARVLALSGDPIAARELAQQAIDATDPPLSPSHREAARKLAVGR